MFVFDKRETIYDQSPINGLTLALFIQGQLSWTTFDSAVVSVCLPL